MPYDHEDYDSGVAEEDVRVEQALALYHRVYHEHFPQGGDAADHDEAHREALTAIIDEFR